MTARFLTSPLILGLLMLTAAPAAAQPHLRCFSISEMAGWRSPDGKSIYIRAGADRYFRIDLARQCGTLRSIYPHLVLQTRGSDLICSALDLDVKASESPGGIVEPCFPKSFTELSAAEAAALPKDAKP